MINYLVTIVEGKCVVENSAISDRIALDRQLYKHGVDYEEMQVHVHSDERNKVCKFAATDKGLVIVNRFR